MAELENAGGPSPADVLKQIISQIRPAFDGPLPSELQDAVPDLDPLFLYKLADREVVTDQFTCASNHIHRTISLVETFKKAAGYGGPEISLDDAFDQVEEKAAEVPEGAVVLSFREVVPGYNYDKETGNIRRIFSIADQFETEASLSAPRSPGVIFLNPEDLDKIFGKDPGGPENDDDDPGFPPPSGPDFRPY